MVRRPSGPREGLALGAGLVRRAVPCALGLVLVALPACGGGHDASEKQIDALQTEIVKLRAQTSILAERLDALELAQGKFRGERGGPGGGDARSRAGAAARAEGEGDAGEDRPPLDVVRLSPDSQGDEGDDEGPRPVLRSVGGGGVIEDMAASAPRSDAAASRDYEEALELYRSKGYDKAIQAFTSFLARYPDHANADNAIYWRGECYMAKGEHRRAVEEFEAVVTGYPKGNKVPDALLRLSQSLSQIGEVSRAEQARKKLLAQHPSSDAARKLDKAGARTGTAGGKP